MTIAVSKGLFKPIYAENRLACLETEFNKYAKTIPFIDDGNVKKSW